MLVSIVVPVYNEENLLPTFLNALLSFLKKNLPSFELLVIENGSKDKSLEIANDFSRKNKKVKVFHLEKPSYGQALLYGIKKAKGKYLVIFNVDFWDKRFIELCQVNLLGYDLVIGSKNLPGSQDRRPFPRRLITQIFNFFLKIFFGFSGTDTHGVKVFHRGKILPLVRKCRLRTGIFDSELVLRAQRHGLKILELPVNVFEKRPNRFGLRRILTTPKDLLELYLVLHKK